MAYLEKDEQTLTQVNCAVLSPFSIPSSRSKLKYTDSSIEEAWDHAEHERQ